MFFFSLNSHAQLRLMNTFEIYIIFAISTYAFFCRVEILKECGIKRTILHITVELEKTNIFLMNVKWIFCGISHENKYSIRNEDFERFYHIFTMSMLSRSLIYLIFTKTRSAYLQILHLKVITFTNESIAIFISNTLKHDKF